MYDPPRHVVLDEADQMLERGFAESVEEILAASFENCVYYIHVCRIVCVLLPTIIINYFILFYFITILGCLSPAPPQLRRGTSHSCCSSLLLFLVGYKTRPTDTCHKTRF